MTAFRAWSFPESFSWSGRTAEVRCEPGGGRIAHPLLDGNEARALAGRIRTAGEEVLARYPVARIVRVLGRVGERFLDPGDRLAREALDRLPHAVGLSAAMAERVLEGMARDWTVGRLRSLVEAEFPDPAVLDEFRPGHRGTRIRALGPRLGLHVSAGTVPGVSVTSLLRGLLVKSAVLLKPGRGDAVLPVLYARGLREEDPELAGALAVVYWPGGAGEAEEALLEEADAVVVHGGNDAVRRLRDRTPVTARFVAYRHRLSVGLVGRGALDGERGAGVADAAARAVAIFDQRGCVSPHAFFVERGGQASAREWARTLARSLKRIEEALPSGPLLPEEAAEIQQVRGTAELEAAAGAGPGGAPRRGGCTLDGRRRARRRVHAFLPGEGRAGPSRGPAGGGAGGPEACPPSPADGRPGVRRRAPGEARRGHREGRRGADLRPGGCSLAARLVAPRRVGGSTEPGEVGGSGALRPRLLPISPPAGAPLARPPSDALRWVPLPPGR